MSGPSQTDHVRFLSSERVNKPTLSVLLIDTAKSNAKKNINSHLYFPLLLSHECIRQLWKYIQEHFTKN